MIRLLLTLLALASGFCAQGAGAEVRIGAAPRGQAAIVQLLRVAEVRQARAVAARFQPAPPTGLVVAKAPALPVFALAATTTAIGIDRARE